MGLTTEADDEPNAIPGAKEEDFVDASAPPDDYIDAQPDPVSSRQPPVAPILRNTSASYASDLERSARYAQAVDDFDVRQQETQARRDSQHQKKEHNIAARADSLESGRQYSYDVNGIAQPRIDPSTKQQAVVPRKSPVRYDEQGRPFQVLQNEGGIPGKKIVNPDAKADIGENPDDPNDPFIYRKNKATGWEPIDPEAGLHDTDNAIAIASAKALHRRELAKAEGAKADISIALSDPNRPPALPDKKRIEVDSERTALAEPIPQPAPKNSWLGGINQEATARANADWQAQEDERKTRLVELDATISADDEHKSLKQQAYDLAVQHKALKDEGPAGFLQRRRKEKSAEIASMPPEEAQSAIEQKVAEVAQTDSGLQTNSAEISRRWDEHNAKRQAGGTADQMAQWDAEAAGIAADAEVLNRGLAQRNAQVEQIRSGAEAQNMKRAEAIKAQRETMRQDPKLAPVADQLDQLDAEESGRAAAVEAMPAGPGKDAARAALSDEMVTKRAEPQAAAKKIQYPQIAKQESELRNYAASLQEGSPEKAEADARLSEIDKSMGADPAYQTARASRQKFDEQVKIIGDAGDRLNAWFQTIRWGKDGTPFRDTTPETLKISGEKSDLENKALEALDTPEQVDEFQGAVRNYRIQKAIAGIPDTQGFLDKLNEVKNNPAQLVPFIASVPELGAIADIAESARHIQAGTGTDDDFVALAAFAAQNQSKKTMWYNVANVLAMLPAFAGELVATGGLYTAGKEAAVKGAVKALESVTAKGAAAWVEKMAVLKMGEAGARDLLGNLAVKGAASLVGSAAQLPAASFGRIAVEDVQRTMPQLQEMAKNEKGEASFLIQDGEPIVSGTINSIANQYVEVFSEHSGGGFDILGKAIGKAIPPKLRGQIGKAFVFGKWMEKNPGASPSTFGKLLKDAGWNGVFQEIGEERVGDLARGFTEFAQRLAGGQGLKDAAAQAYQNNAPDGQQWLTELISFSIPGMAITGANRLLGRSHITGTEPSNPTGAAPILPEQMAAADAEIANSPMPERIPAMAAALKLVAGTQFDALTKAEQDAVKPHTAKVDGQIVVTDDILAEMQSASPAVASLVQNGSIRDEATRRQEILSRPEDGAQIETQKGGVELGKVQTEADAHEGQGRQEVLTQQDVPAGEQSGGASQQLLPAGKAGAIVTRRERAAAVQISRALENRGADPALAKEFSHYVVRRDGTDNWTGARALAAVKEFQDAGGLKNPEAIRKSLAANQTFQKPEVDAIYNDVLTQLKAAPKVEGRPHYDDLADEQKIQLEQVIRHRIAPEILVYGKAIADVRASMEKKGGAGAAATAKGTLAINVGDLLARSELAHFADDRGVERIINEEVGHLVGVQVLAEQRRTRTKDATTGDHELAMAEAAEIWDGLPADVQAQVRGIREMKENSSQLGMEFLRMVLQHDLAVDSAGHVLQGKTILTEETLHPDIVARIKKFLTGILQTISRLKAHLQETLADSPEKAAYIARIEAIRKQSVEAFKNFQKQADESRSRAYSKNYDEAQSSSEPSGRGGDRRVGPESRDGGNPDGTPVGEAQRNIPAPEGSEKGPGQGVQHSEVAGVADAAGQNPAAGMSGRRDVTPKTSETGYDFTIRYQPKGGSEILTEKVHLEAITIADAREEQRRALLRYINKGTLKGAPSQLVATVIPETPEVARLDPTAEQPQAPANEPEADPTTEASAAPRKRQPATRADRAHTPIIAWLEEHGGIQSKKKSGTSSGGEYEQSGGVRAYGAWAKSIYGNGMPADVAVTGLVDAGLMPEGSNPDDLWVAIGNEIMGANRVAARENKLGEEAVVVGNNMQAFEEATQKAPGKILTSTSDMAEGQILDAGAAGRFLVEHKNEHGDAFLAPVDAPEDGKRKIIVENGKSIYLSGPVEDGMETPFSIASEPTGGIGISTVERAIRAIAKNLGMESILTNVSVVGDITDKSGAARASRSSAEDIDFARRASQELAQNDEIFRYPASTSKGLEEVFADVFPDAKYLGEDTRPDEREESQADRRFVFSLSGKNFYVFERGSDVWIDVSRLEEGDGGAGVYAAVGNYARNSRRDFVGDPNGVSETAVVRRTSAMLSLALRFGTTDFMSASPEQIRGDAEKGIAPLDWTGNSTSQTNALIASFLGTLANRFPALQNYRFDFGSGSFLDAAGRPVGGQRFQDGGRSKLGRTARAGKATLRRGIFLKSLVESPSGEKPQLLEKLLAGQSALLSEDGLAQIFSRRNAGGQIEGYYDPRTGKIVLNASAISSPKRAMEVFLHEVVGHGGMAAALQGINPKGYANLSRVLQNFKREDGSSLWADVQARYPGKSDEVLFDEALARLAEKPARSERETNLFKRIVEMIRQWLAQKGFSNWTAADVDALIRRSADAARRGLATQEKAAKFSRLQDDRNQMALNFSPEEASREAAKPQGEITPHSSLPGNYPDSLETVHKSTSVSSLRVASRKEGEALVPLDPDPVLPGKTPDMTPVSVDYRDAKKGVDGAAAARIIAQVLKPAVVDDLRAALNPDVPVVFVPVRHQDPGLQHNAIPIYYAGVLAKLLDGTVDTEIYKASGSALTHSGVEKRMNTVQEFDGPIHLGVQYVVVDDAFTSGNTLTALIAHIHEGGREVVLATSLADSQSHNYLKPREKDVQKLVDRSGVSRVEMERELGFPIAALTGSEIFRLAHLDKKWTTPASLAERFPDRRRIFQARSLADSVRGRRGMDEAGSDRQTGQVQEVTPQVDTAENPSQPAPMPEENRAAPDTKGTSPQSDQEARLSAEEQTWGTKVYEPTPDGKFTARLFHGTWRGGYDTFNEGTHFSKSEKYAANYMNPSASSMGISGEKKATKQMVYAADVTFKNIFDTRKPEARQIYQNEFFGKWGNGTELSDRGLPDWTDSIDLEEFLKEKYGDKFDGLVLDEGGVPVGNDVLLRPESYVPFSSDQIRILPSAETSGAPSPGGRVAEDYRINHRPRSDGPPAFDLLQGDLMPPDVYDKPEFYVGDPSAKSTKETIRALRAVRGKPDAEITIFRASPKSELNSGDWVALSKSYATQHGMADDPSSDVPVHSFKVKARDLVWSMDDLNEFGYYPESPAPTRGAETVETEKGTMLHARSNDPNQREFTFDDIPEDHPQAQEDADKTALVRFQTELPQAMRIAARYANIPGVDSDEVRQTARIALANAAREFDPARGKPFAAMAGVSVNNALRTLYRKEDIRRERFPHSLDEPIQRDSAPTGSTRGDFAQDARTRSATDTAALDETRAMLDRAIGELPGRMQTAVRGFLDGRQLDDIGLEMGVSKQAVSQMQKVAFARLQKKFSEQGIDATAQLMARGNDPSENPVYKMAGDSYSHGYGISESLSPDAGTPVGEAGKGPEAESPWRPAPDKSAQTYSGPYGIPAEQAFAGIAYEPARAWGVTRLAKYFQTTGGERDRRLSFSGTGELPIYRSDYRAHNMEFGLAQEIATKEFQKALRSIDAAYALHPGRAYWMLPRTPQARALFTDAAGKVHLLDHPHGEIALAEGEPLFSRPNDADGYDAEIDQLIADLTSAGKLDFEDIADNQATALSEEASGAQKQIGRPDLAYGNQNADVRGADQAYSDKFTTETVEQWEKEAQAMIARDYEGTRKAILAAGLAGETLSPAQTKAATIIAADLRRDMLKEGTEAARKAFNVFWYAYRASGTTAGREMAARRDPFMTPAQRYQDFLLGLMLKPRKATVKAIEAAPSNSQKDARIAALEKRLKLAVAQSNAHERASLEKQIVVEKAASTKEFLIDAETQALLDKLKAAGISPEDIMQDKVSLSMVYKNIKKSVFDAILARGNKDARRQAMELILKNKAFAVIAKETGLPESEVRQLKADFIAKLRSDHFSKFQAGAKADGSALLTGKKVDDATAEREFKKFLANFGIVDESAQGKPKFDVEDPAHVMRLARAIQHARGETGVGDMMFEYWIMNILSGPQTHVANITGNLGMASLNLTVQRGAEAMVNLVLRDSKAAQLGEFKYLVKGLLPGLAKGFTMGTRAWSAEQDFFEHTVLGTPIELDQWDKLGGTRSAIPGKIGKLIRVPGRALLFADSLFKTAIGQMEAAAHAYRIAKTQGLSGDALSRRVALLTQTRGEVVASNLARSKPTGEMVEYFARQLARRNPELSSDELVADASSDAWTLAREQTAFDLAKTSGWTEEAWTRAVESARVNTFQQDLKTTAEGGSLVEDVASKLQQARFGNKLIGFFFPFVKTPYNVFRVGLRKSPLGGLNLAAQVSKGLYSMKNGRPYLEGHPEAVRDLAEQALAWGAFALLYAAAQGDPDDDDKWLLMTGSQPVLGTSRGQRDLNARAFGGEYVIRIGGRNGISIPYGRLEPIATVLGTTIDAIRATKRNGNTADNLNALWAFIAGQMNNKSFLQGMQNITDLAQGRRDPANMATKTALQFLVPNLIRQPLRNIDDYARDSKTAGPEYMVLPSAGNAEPQINVYGKAVDKGSTPLARIFFASPLATDPTLNQTDALLLNWNRENPQEAYAPQVPVATFKGPVGKDGSPGKNIEMTAEEATRFRVAAGRLASIKLRAVVNARNAAHPSEHDLQAVKKAFEDGRREAKERIFSPSYILRRGK